MRYMEVEHSMIRELKRRFFGGENGAASPYIAESASVSEPGETYMTTNGSPESDNNSSDLCVRCSSKIRAAILKEAIVEIEKIIASDPEIDLGAVHALQIRLFERSLGHGA